MKRQITSIILVLTLWSFAILQTACDTAKTLTTAKVTSRAVVAGVETAKAFVIALLPTLNIDEQEVLKQAEPIIQQIHDLDATIQSMSDLKNKQAVIDAIGKIITLIIQWNDTGLLKIKNPQVHQRVTLALAAAKGTLAGLSALLGGPITSYNLTPAEQRWSDAIRKGLTENDVSSITLKFTCDAADTGINLDSCILINEEVR
jgi:hypothetical protein